MTDPRADKGLRARFWARIPLDQLRPAEWEALCDGCGKCCLLKLEDAETAEVAFTCVGCRLLDGNPVDVARLLALAGPAPVVLALDLRRYERWLIDTLGAARDAGAWIVALTDDVLSPVARAADLSFAVAAASTGPFDSHVATLALLDLFVAEVAAARRVAATERIDRIEAAWTAADALTD